MALGLFAKLKKRKTVVPELNKAATKLFASIMEELADELESEEALDLIRTEVISQINDPDERRALVNMMVVQEFEPDVIIHICMIQKIKENFDSSGNAAGDEYLNDNQIQLIKLYHYAVDWLAEVGFMTVEKAEELKEGLRKALFVDVFNGII